MFRIANSVLFICFFFPFFSRLEWSSKKGRNLQKTLRTFYTYHFYFNVSLSLILCINAFFCNICYFYLNFVFNMVLFLLVYHCVCRFFCKLSMALYWLFVSSYFCSKFHKRMFPLEISVFYH